MAIRQPVVSVLGHVDHGKTKLLDRIRGTSVQAREAGAITQHIGATEVPIDHIYKVCGNLIGKKRFDVPGLLFIDTPGHHSFITLRARGGSLADIAVLVIDIREGLMPQTIESIKILRQYKTPFIIALNKIDTIQGWSCEEGRAFVLSERTQQEHTIAAFNEKLYSIIGDLSNEGIYADRYDRIEDFTKTVALVPISAKEGEGIPDLLLMLIGLAQRFLEQQLKQEDGAPSGPLLLLELSLEEPLCQTDEHQQKVGDSLSLLGRYRHERDCFGKVLDPVVPVGVDPFVGQVSDYLVQFLIERSPGVVLLLPLGEHERPSLLAAPSLDGIDLVEGDDERRFVLSQDLDRLDGLGHQPLTDVDHENGYIGEGTSSRPECDEGMVTGRIDEKQTWHIELLGTDELSADLVDVVYGDLGGTDVLCDGSRFPRLYRSTADPVQELGLSVIDVSEDTDHGLSDSHLGHLFLVKG